MAPYLRCSGCRQFFPRKMLTVGFFQKSSAQPTCPVCGAVAEFHELSAEEMSTLASRQNRSWLHQIVGILIGVAVFVWLRWIGFI